MMLRTSAWLASPILWARGYALPPRDTMALTQRPFQRLPSFSKYRLNH